MSKQTTFLGFLAAGGGAILLFSAYRNESPFDVVKDALTGDKSARSKINSGLEPNLTGSGGAMTPIDDEDATGGGGGGYGARFSGGSGTSERRTAAIAAGGTYDSGEWVKANTIPKVPLAPVATQSINQVVADYGKPIYVSGGGRSYAQQVLGYNSDPNRFAKPGNSLHEAGLAIDLDQGRMNLENPSLIAAFTKNGWVRAGKKGDWYNNGQQIPEPWHWSKGIAG